jgi:DNA invertase Pin-like site-specific DNA recombinase
MGQIWGYARVSTEDQELGLQITALREAGVPEKHIGLSVICVQKVPLRKAGEINALCHTLRANQLEYLQIQLFGA